MILPLPLLAPHSQPVPTAGRYLVDFGDQTAAGLTAAQVAALLESERYAHIKVYRIHRALPDGRMELVGVPHARFHAEDGFFFFRVEPQAAAADFHALCSAASAQPPPCRARLHLARLPHALHAPHLVALIFPAEFADDMSAWLSRIAYLGGDRVEAGASLVSAYLLDETKAILDRRQLWGTDDGTLTESHASPDRHSLAPNDPPRRDTADGRARRAAS